MEYVKLYTNGLEKTSRKENIFTANNFEQSMFSQQATWRLAYTCDKFSDCGRTNLIIFFLKNIQCNYKINQKVSVINGISFDFVCQRNFNFAALFQEGKFPNLWAFQWFCRKASLIHCSFQKIVDYFFGVWLRCKRRVTYAKIYNVGFSNHLW